MIIKNTIFAGAEMPLLQLIIEELVVFTVKSENLIKKSRNALFLSLLYLNFCTIHDIMN